MYENYPGTVTRVWGPPGTGKTQYLAGYVREVMTLNGQDCVLVSSFSTTAAKTIAERFSSDSMRPNKRMVGTLHSHAFRAVGNGNVALDPKVLADWNSQVTPELRITPDNRRNGGDSGETGSFAATPEEAVTGDQLISAMDKLRATLTPVEDWPGNVRDFATRFTAWKREADAMDFTDMIEQAWERARDGECAPGNPQFVVSDESQDMTPLESRLVFAWGQHPNVTRLVIGMDDDQAINQWRGGDPMPLLNLNGPNVTDHILNKSHRVPESVRLAAERWIRFVSVRKEKAYGARTRTDEHGVDTGEVVGGTAFHIPDTIQSPSLVLRIVRDLDAGKEVMIIASCNYMLAPLISNLRMEGVPFHNPYRPAESKWNPFGVAREGSMSTAERVYRYLSLADQDWTGDDVRAWGELVKIKDAGLRSDAKRVIAGWPSEPIPYEDIEALFANAEALDRATQPDPDWLAGCLLAAKKPVAEYPLAVARQRGHQALREEPRLVVGTVHSVKGAGADVVYLCPNVSGAASRNNKTVAGRDEMVRLFYVGMTRAKESLRVLTANPGGHVVGLVPADLEVMG